MEDGATAPAVERWLKEIKDAEAREKKYRTSTKNYVDEYEGAKENRTPFAILYSNVS